MIAKHRTAEFLRYGHSEADRNLLSTDTASEPRTGAARNERVGAGDAYSNAALEKLRKRFGANYSPPPPDLVMRPFVMPQYNAPRDQAKAQEKALAAQLRGQGRKLPTTSSRPLANRRTLSGQPSSVAGAMAPSKKRRAARREKREAVDRIRREIGAKRRRRRKAGPQDRVEEQGQLPGQGLLWVAAKPKRSGRMPNVLSVSKKRRRALRERYRLIEEHGLSRYYQGDRLAFVERADTVIVHADQSFGDPSTGNVLWRCGFVRRARRPNRTPATISEHWISRRIGSFVAMSYQGCRTPFRPERA